MVKPYDPASLSAARLEAAVDRLAARLGQARSDGSGPSRRRDHAELLRLARDGQVAEEALDAVHDAQALIAAQAERIAQLELLSCTDELTGLLNRRGFMREIDLVLAHARRYGECGVLMFIDLDGFKLVNDNHGHAAGDAILRHVGHVLRENVREVDLAARLGGDEFAVLLVRTAWDDGLKRAEHIERLLETACVPWRGWQLAAPASIGMYAYDEAADAAALMDHADADMYQTKRLREGEAVMAQRASA